MDLRQLRHLLAVVDHGSFSAAARALHTVQSNVSTHVAKLEKELGTVLVDRRTMQPTPEGQAVIERARRIGSEIQAIGDDILSMRDQVGGQVRIGCIGTTARWVATSLLERLRVSYPGVHPVLVDASSNVLTPQVLNGELDMAVVNAPAVNAALDAEHLFDEERVIVAPSYHPLANQPTVTLEELSQHEVMLTPQGETFRDSVDEELAQADIELRTVAEVDGLRLLASLAYQGHIPALLPASAASGYPTEEWSVVRVEGLSKRSVLLIRNRQTTPSLPARASREVLHDVIRKIGPNQPGIHVTLAP
jgi:LysR family hydrogen peroxide-inducible transcriptional activator